MKQAGRRASGLLMVAIGALALGYCGGGGSGAGPVGPSVPPVTTPTPTPGPTPDPPVSSSCTKLAVGSPNAPCRAENPEYVDVVYQAIRTLQTEQSYIFDGDEVKSVGAYYVELIKVLDRQGLCAETDGEELGVTDGSSSNEQYDVLTAQNRVRFGPTSYRTTCRPSSIPLAPRGLGPQMAGCPLAAEPRDRLRPRAIGQVPRRRRTGHRAAPEGEAGAVQLQRDGAGNQLAAGQGPRRLQQRPPRDPDPEGLLREVRRRGDRAQAGLEYLQRAVRRQLPGQVHPDRLWNLPRELLPGGLLRRGSGGRLRSPPGPVAPAQPRYSSRGIVERGRTVRVVVGVP